MLDQPTFVQHLLHKVAHSGVADAQLTGQLQPTGLTRPGKTPQKQVSLRNIRFRIDLVDHQSKYPCDVLIYSLFETPVNHKIYYIVNLLLRHAVEIAMMMAMPVHNTVWDMHHHWVNEDGYIDRLLATMDRLSIEKTGLIAMGNVFADLFIRHGRQTGSANNTDLSRLVKQHADRFWGWGFIHLGHHEVEDVDRLAEMGMSGLKFHVPVKPYSDESYFPVYERAQALQLPCLFHTGIVFPAKPEPELRIRSENYRPIHLEPIAHVFPGLKMIIAHMGVCWNDEAATLCRMCSNIWADMSGRVDGWRSSKSIEWFKQLLYWPEAHRKILFGSDVHADEIDKTLEHHITIFQQMGWNESQIKDILHLNAVRLIGGEG
ncbi:MAG: amidohydrolase family protein [Phycisphaeraceae bacterium]|nr:amidohydrolase family protein [Phycisphaeraceae bacterium]